VRARTRQIRAASQLDDVDIVLASYQLLLRIASLLTLRKWHLVILDEAQVIKNRKTLAADVCRRLKANHRVCMTGTPVENHLGDLWSLFAVLMPGLLNTHDISKRVFRDPIEKFADAHARAFLAARIRPFLLRRTQA
jgi:non-specific serine/threonine protein kinase